MKITKIEATFVKSLKEYCIKIIGMSPSKFGGDKETVLITLWSETKPEITGLNGR